MITTVEATPRSACLHVAGKLDRCAAIMLCELALAHAELGRDYLTIDVSQVSGTSTTALDVLAHLVCGSPSSVALSAFSPAAVGELTHPFARVQASALTGARVFTALQGGRHD